MIFKSKDLARGKRREDSRAVSQDLDKVLGLAPKGIFASLTVFVKVNDVHGNSVTRTIKKLLTDNGGNVGFYLFSGTELVVTDNTQVEVIEQARQLGLMTVGSQWVIDSLRQRKRLDPSSYLLEAGLKKLTREPRLKMSRKRTRSKVKRSKTENRPSKRLNEIFPRQDRQSNKSIERLSSRAARDKDSNRLSSLQTTPLGKDNMVERRDVLDRENRPIADSSKSAFTQKTILNQSRKKSMSDMKSHQSPHLDKHIKRRFTLVDIDVNDPLKYLDYLQKKVKKALRL